MTPLDYQPPRKRTSRRDAVLVVLGVGMLVTILALPLLLKAIKRGTVLPPVVVAVFPYAILAKQAGLAKELQLAALLHFVVYGLVIDMCRGKRVWALAGLLLLHAAAAVFALRLS